MLNYLADLYLQEGQLAQAEAAIREALQNHLNGSSVELGLAADDLMILAKVLSKQGRHREAYEAARQASSAFRKQVGTDTTFLLQIDEIVEEIRKKGTYKELEASESSGGNRGIAGK